MTTATPVARILEFERWQQRNVTFDGFCRRVQANLEAAVRMAARRAQREMVAQAAEAGHCCKDHDLTSERKCPVSAGAM